MIISPFLVFGPHGLFPARPVHPPLPLPAQPSRRSRPSSRAQPGTAAQPRASASLAQQPRLRPHQATARAQPLTARAHLSAPPPTSRSPRAATVAHERRRRSAPPRASAASNSSPTPPRAPGCPPLSFSRLPSTEEGRNRRCRGRRDPPSSSSGPPRGQPPPSRLRLHFPLGELLRPPLYLPVHLTPRFVGFLSLGRKLRGPWSPAMVATALAAVPGRQNGMAATPFSPRALGCPRWSVW